VQFSAKAFFETMANTFANSHIFRYSNVNLITYKHQPVSIAGMA
jgi:hypothetical protein